MAVVVVTPPEPLVDLATAKQHLREDAADEDQFIEALVAAASAWIDGPTGWLGRAVREQVLELRGNVFCCGEALPYGPVSEIVSVKYVSATGSEETVPPVAYRLEADRLVRTEGHVWPALRGDAEGVRIQYKVGSDQTPPAIAQAILLIVGSWFRTRESENIGNIVNEMPMGAEAILKTYRRWIS